MPIQRLRDFVTERKMEATFTMAADAREGVPGDVGVRKDDSGGPGEISCAWKRWG